MSDLEDILSMLSPVEASKDVRGRAMAYRGSTTDPMNSISPVILSRIAKKNG